MSRLKRVSQSSVGGLSARLMSAPIGSEHWAATLNVRSWADTSPWLSARTKNDALGPKHVALRAQYFSFTVCAGIIAGGFGRAVASAHWMSRVRA